MSRSISSISAAAAQAEDPQQLAGIGIGRVQEELVEGIREVSAGSRNERIGLGLAVLGAVRPCVMSGVASAWTDAPSTRRIRSTPAVRFPHWSQPPVCSWHRSGGKLQVVQRLQDLVAELGEADPAPAMRALTDSLAIIRAYAEVLADVAQEVEGVQVARPVQVVHDAGRVVAIEAQQAGRPAT